VELVLDCVNAANEDEEIEEFPSINYFFWDLERVKDVMRRRNGFKDNVLLFFVCLFLKDGLFFLAQKEQVNWTMIFTFFFQTHKDTKERNNAGMTFETR
jgi:hypothetical protein